VCFLSLNPVFQFLGIRGSALLVLLSAATLLQGRIRTSEARHGIYILIGLLVVTSAASALLNDVVTPLVFAGFFGLTAVAVLQTSYLEAVAMVRFASALFLVFIGLAIVGVAYQLLGGSPLLTLPNADGRDNDLYLTTFSNAYTFTIRPSAIYDEPGAFSFYICALVILRSRIGMSRRTSAVLMLGGLITQSITHVFATLLWFVWAMNDRRQTSDRKVRSNRLAFLAVFFSVAAIIYSTGLLDWAFERALMFYNNPWTNPRQRTMQEIVDALNMRQSDVLVGFDPACIERAPTCNEYGENPLTPLIYGGLMVSWPYYLFLLTGIVSPLFSRDGILLVIAALLFLQRPYLLEFPYSGLFALGIVVWCFRTASSAGEGVVDSGRDIDPPRSLPARGS
jgi:hypothetical protein